MDGARRGCVAGMLALTLAGSAWAQTPTPTPPPRPRDLASEAPPREPSPRKSGEAVRRERGSGATTPDAAPAPTPGDACLIELAALGADAPKADAPPAGDMGCSIEAPVLLKSVATREGRLTIHGEPLIACSAARAVALYLAQIVAPLAKGATGQALSGVTAAGFQCRPRNSVAGAKLSAHGKGLALDVMSFQFSDSSIMTVAAPAPERAALFAGLRKGACGYFTTVLGPGADEAHRDHLHLDIEAHGSSGYGRICQ